MPTVRTQSISTIPYNYDVPALPTPQVRKKSYAETFRKLNAMRQKLFERRPGLYNITQKLGPMTMYQISESYAKTSIPDVLTERKNEFILAFSDEVAKILGQGIAASAARQLAEHYYVSTAEHHSPITTPGFFNTSVHSALYAAKARNSKLENVIVLACANISFDNYSSPRSLVFNSISENKAELNNIPLFPRSARPCPVINYSGYTQQSIQNAKIRVDNLLRGETITRKVAEKLYFLIDKIYGRADILSLPSFSDQITKTNSILWNKLFFFLGKYIPNLIYLEQERLVNRLLLAHHIHKKTPIHNFMFDSKFHELMEKHFDGIGGAFSLKEKIGTYLFWGLPPGQRYRVSLWKEGKKLISEDKSYEVELTPAGIAQAIERKELIPSTMLDYILLSMYYGLRLHGGVNQTTTLTKTKTAYISVLKDAGDIENAKQSKNVVTTGLSMTRPSLAFLKSPDGLLVPASSLDILLHGDEHSWQAMKQNAKNITYEETFLRSLPSFYRFVYKKDEQDKDLLSLSELDIDKFLGLDKKIVPFAEIK